MSNLVSCRDEKTFFYLQRLDGSKSLIVLTAVLFMSTSMFLFMFSLSKLIPRTDYTEHYFAFTKK